MMFNTTAENHSNSYNFNSILICPIINIAYKSLTKVSHPSTIQYRMSKKQKQAGLGKALKNKLEKKHYISATGDRAPMFYQETEENEAEKKKIKMRSVLEQNSLTQFLHTAQMSQQDFHANRNIKLKDIREELTTKKIITNNPHELVRFTRPKIEGNPIEGLQMPRRPEWKQATKEQLEKLQNEAYLSWRRRLAEVEEKNDAITITPYEKNLEVWKQLWRVVERADVLAQIIDGRNPLFFFCEDLFSYAREHGKTRFLLIINKSDLIEPNIREAWNAYFREKAIDHCFFTAKEEAWTEGEEAVALNTPQVLSPQQLVEAFRGLAVEGGKVEIGLTGYPNVGKSSVINAVLGKKKVGVASMPGKTKHFQTLKLTDEVTLCDCPGLVFPKVSESKAEMVLNGLYPIDNVVQYEEPAELIAFRISRPRIEQQYSLQWKENEPYDGESILIKYAKLKGYYTGNGLPNQAQAARQILKDYVNGLIVYNHPPPTHNTPDFEQHQAQLELQKLNFEKKEEKTEQHLDQDFFDKEEKFDITAEQIVEALSEDDLLDIVEGKRVDGLRITKEIRKEIKFALKRGAKLEEVRKILQADLTKNHKLLIKN